MIKETISAFIILCIAILSLDTNYLKMSDGFQSVLILAMVISFLAFSAYITRERSADERDSVHILKASRLSYLVGVGVLIVGIIVQTFSHEVDRWLVLALCSMIFSKLISRIYSQYRM